MSKVIRYFLNNIHPSKEDQEALSGLLSRVEMVPELREELEGFAVRLLNRSASRGVKMLF